MVGLPVVGGVVADLGPACVDRADLRATRLEATARGVKLLQEGRRRRVARLAQTLATLGPDDLEVAGQVERTLALGGSLASGGSPPDDPALADGYFYLPTVVVDPPHDSPMAIEEVFGPALPIWRVKDFDQAIALANDSPFGLTASIHTQNLNRAMTFLARIQSGVAVVNGGTYGSEPHLPFGGLRQSGNGWREAGTQALDVYSDLKTIYINHNPAAV